MATKKELKKALEQVKDLLDIKARALEMVATALKTIAVKYGGIRITQGDIHEACRAAGKLNLEVTKSEKIGRILRITVK